MGVPDRLEVAPETTTSHHAKLSDDGQNVPAGDVIALIHGDGADPISEQFLLRLRAAATVVGQHTDIVRAAVTQNADALKQAATDLTDVDSTGVDTFSAVNAIVDQTKSDTTATDVTQAAGSALNDGQVKGDGALSHGNG